LALITPYELLQTSNTPGISVSNLESVTLRLVKLSKCSH